MPAIAAAARACWIAAVGLGEIKYEDVPALIQFKQMYQPQAQHRALYDERFEVFKQIYKQMKNIHARLNTAAP